MTTQQDFDDFGRPHGQLRCDDCGAEFTTEALLADHVKTHQTSDPAEQEEIIERQAERKP
jgi:hypothetical protein